MLSKLLSKQDCAQCKFCCEFDGDDIWEFPFFDADEVRYLKTRFPDVTFVPAGNGCQTVALDNGYLKCPFLSDGSGCMLPDEYKPFDCKIWPFRVMKREGDTVLVLEPICNVVNRYPTDTLKAFVHQSGIVRKAAEYAVSDVFKIKDYRDGFPIMAVLDTEAPGGAK